MLHAAYLQHDARFPARVSFLAQISAMQAQWSQSFCAIGSLAHFTISTVADASVWIFQFMKAMRDEEGNFVANGHLLGFFRRICRLLFNKIRPIFVFDGATPLLKKLTVAARRQRRETAGAQAWPLRHQFSSTCFASVEISAYIIFQHALRK